MKINLQVNKMMIKMNKQSYYMCLLGIVERPGVSWGNKTDPSKTSLGNPKSFLAI